MTKLSTKLKEEFLATHLDRLWVVCVICDYTFPRKHVADGTWRAPAVTKVK